MPSKHEILTFINLNDVITKKQVAKYFSRSYITVSEAINRLHRQRLIRIVGKNGKDIVYELTDRGLERLRYFDSGGCPNKDCSCQE
jgi:chromosome segregation and condensation protein ScpB